MNAHHSQSWSLTARWVVPVDSPPLADGVVAIRGEHIAAVGPRDRTPDLDLGNAVILPGLVNAHTHLDLTGLHSKCPPDHDFTGWLRRVIEYRRSQTPEQIAADIRAGLRQSIRHGTTLLGDISAEGNSWPVLCEAPIRSVVFYELLGLTEDRARRAWDKAQQWLVERRATTVCRPGLSPHAPYSVRRSLFQQLAALPREVPVAVHLAETCAEVALLSRHEGPFVPFLQQLGVWDPNGLARDIADVVELLQDRRALYVHGNYLEAQAAMMRGESVVFCPRTHAAFGHEPHPFDELQRHGARIALGTDSLASNPGLDVLGEMREVRRRYPQVPPATCIHWATLGGAQALGWEAETGSLTPGKSADLVVIPLPNRDGDPLSLLLESEQPVEQVLCRGKWISQREP